MAKVHSDAVRKKRLEFEWAVKFLESRKLVFIDEFGANEGMTPNYGRAPSGERVRIDKPAMRSKNHTFVGAISLKGVLSVESLQGAATIENLLAWVREHLAPHLKKGMTVVMDNLKAHRNPQLIEAIQKTGAKILFLPPYSPEFNPIEECWSKIKNGLRAAQARTLEGLLNALELALLSLSPSDFKGWFKHAGYRV